MGLYQQLAIKKSTGLFTWKGVEESFHKLQRVQPLDATDTDRVTLNALIISVPPSLPRRSHMSLGRSAQRHTAADLKSDCFRRHSLSQHRLHSHCCHISRPTHEWVKYIGSKTA